MHSLVQVIRLDDDEKVVAGVIKMAEGLPAGNNEMRRSTILSDGRGTGMFQKEEQAGNTVGTFPAYPFFPKTGGQELNVPTKVLHGVIPRRRLLSHVRAPRARCCLASHTQR